MAKFQQRHYETIAQAVQDEKASYVTEGAPIRIGALQSFAERLAGIFARDNSHFDRHRFLTACEPGANVRGRRNVGPAMPYKKVAP